ncbi:MAG: hypothetical protein M1376_12935, partial [Planctomycetes bacterium]|nr:hypothetical protein [Planctomycetota bacterium]
EGVLTRMAVREGRIVLPDGMSYRLLVLPQTTTMTPALLRKIKDLVAAGATVLGPRPTKSPSLSDYPRCDEEVRQLADDLWGNCDGKSVKEHAFGKGKIVWGPTPEETLTKSGVPPDFTAGPFVRWIHRNTDDAEIYFVTCASQQPTDTLCAFRAEGKRPEFWQPQTGRIEPAAMYEQVQGVTRIPIHFEPGGSVFVVFRQAAGSFDPVVRVTRDGRPVLPAPEHKAKVVIAKAVYGVLRDPKRTRDVRAKLQAVVDGGELSFQVARMAQGDDPAFGIVKTLIVEYTADGKPFKVSGTDPEEITLVTSAGSEQEIAVQRGADGRIYLKAWQSGGYELSTAAGRTLRGEAPALPQPLEIPGPWQLRFPPNAGAPEQVTLEKLVSWSEHSAPGVKYFSGTATYTKTITIPPPMLGQNRHLILDLGNVQVVAEVKLNGKDLGLLWKSPYRVEITGAARPGDNALEVRVTNLWVNRMIGDENLPEDSSRNPEGTLKEWPVWVREGKPSPTGRCTFTSWRLWKAGDPLVGSGLVGPVILRVVERVTVK